MPTPNCETCPTEWFCLVACAEVNEKLAKQERELGEPVFYRMCACGVGTHNEDVWIEHRKCCPWAERRA